MVRFSESSGHSQNSNPQSYHSTRFIYYSPETTLAPHPLTLPAAGPTPCHFPTESTRPTPRLPIPPPLLVGATAAAGSPPRVPSTLGARGVGRLRGSERAMEGWVATVAYTGTALACAAAATVVALRLVYRHLLHYAEPTHQRFIVRIILMVPVGTRLRPIPSSPSRSPMRRLRPQLRVPRRV